ncbi:MAG TPA: sigma-70 family RNA polymerase sigma factor, partial [Candidatus Stercoripulliclostridium merdigallinarum]|nr:sigma-70 family RNA polymerase sigma factor [Candidatus Stercoripulliclostridium merdigallinarum]
LKDRIADPGDFNDALDKMLLKDAIMKLKERDRKIIILRYFRDRTQSEVAEELGVSQVQVSRLESKILKQIAKELK